MRNAVRRERAGRTPQLLPRLRRIGTNAFELAPPVPEPGDVGDGGDSERAGLIAAGCDERLEEVGLELLANPPLVQLLEGEEEACACELGDPHGVDDGEIRGLSFRHRVRDDPVEVGSWDRDDVDLDVVRSCLADHGSPRTLRDDDAYLPQARATRDPVRVDERAAPPVPQHHALLGELGESADSRRSADAEALAELVLRRQPVSWAVLPAQDRLQEERLQLEVEGDRLLSVDHRVAR